MTNIKIETGSKLAATVTKASFAIEVIQRRESDLLDLRDELGEYLYELREAGMTFRQIRQVTRVYNPCGALKTYCKRKGLKYRRQVRRMEDEQ